MKRPALPDDERLLDLLAERATRGLDERDDAELRRLLAQHPGIEADELDHAAAAADIALQRRREVAAEPLPQHLRARILRQAESCLPTPAPETQLPRAVPWYRHAAAGWFAAAAMLVVALLVAVGLRPPGPPPVPTLAEQRLQLLEQAPDVVTVAWSPPELEAYAGVEGDVVWSDRHQRGYMRLRGLPVNDPSVEQYQLWIVDPRRDANPVDGGVFDVPGGADEAIIPIDAKLPVREPQLFAITLEQPGGVVVSDGPLLVVAPVRS